MSGELYSAGIYKDNNTFTPDYEGCHDDLSLDSYLNVTDNNIKSAITIYHPEVMKDSDYKVFIDLLSKVITQVDGYSNLVRECYNFDIYDRELIYKLSSLLDINYPFDYGFDKLGLLVENFNKISRVRGEEKAIIMLLRLMDRSESELYLNDEDDTKIVIDDNGVYHITNSRIESINFTKYMIRKVIQAGRSFTFDSDLDCKHYSFSIDTIENLVTHEIFKYKFPEDQVIRDHVYGSSSMSIIHSLDNYKSATDSVAKDDMFKEQLNSLILDSIHEEFVYEYPY